MKNLILILVIFLMSCGGSSSSGDLGTSQDVLADVRVHVFLMNDLTEERREELLERARGHFVDNEIPLEYVAIEEAELFSEDAKDLSLFESNLVTNQFKKWLKDNGHTDRRTIYYAVTPPMDGIWIGGKACGICSYKKDFACGHSNAKNYRPEGFVDELNSIAMAHEIGHIIGASHLNNYPNIMHEAAGQFTGQNLTFDSHSVNQMHGCLTLRRKRIRKRIQKVCKDVENRKRCARKIRRGR